MENALSNQTPLACSLSDAALREREAGLLTQFKAGVSSVQELSNGYAFVLPGKKQWLALIAELMIAERECCPFLTFELLALPKEGPLTMRITGPAGAKEFVKTTFCAPSQPSDFTPLP